MSVLSERRAGFLPNADLRLSSSRAGMSSMRKTAGKLSLPGGNLKRRRVVRQIPTCLELVAQRELHHARVRQQAGVISEVAGVRKRKIQALHVEPR